MCTVEENMKSRRILSGMMSVAMLFSMAATPVYAIEEQAVPGAPDNTYSEPMNGTPEEDNTYKETETNAPVEPADTQAQPDSVPDDAGIGGQPDGTENPAPLALNAPAPLDAEETIREAADRYYGNTGTITVATVSAKWASSVTGENAKTGETMNMVVDWSLTAPATYNYTGQRESMFDTYDNTVIYLTLPEHATLGNVNPATLANVSGIEKQEPGNTWKITLAEHISTGGSSVSGLFTLPVYFEENGALPVGETLGFAQNADIRIETNFTVLDRATQTPTEVETYKKVLNGTNYMTDKTLTTDDIWVLQKTASGSPVVSDDKKTVTVTFTLTVGLDDGNGKPNPNPGTYGRAGRVPLKEVTLTESPKVLDREGNEIEANSITIKPQFGDNPAETTVTKGVAIPLTLDTCAGKTGITLDVADTAPYLSTYTVTMVYDYDKFIAHYSDPNQDPLTIDNNATLTYTLAGETTPRTSTGEATQTAGEVTQPARLDISKYMVDAAGNDKLYGAAYSGDAVSGPATFTITTKDGNAATLYKKEASGRYTKLTDNTVAIDPAGGATYYTGTTGTVTVYLDPGTYTVTEKAVPKNSVRIDETENGTNNAAPKQVTIAAEGQGTAAFYNREQLGSIKITKQDQDQNALKGATFALYSDEACTVKVGESKTSDADGEVLFDRLPYGTYYVKETAAPEGYVGDAAAHEVQVTADAATKTLTVTNTKNTVTAKLQKYMYNGSAYVEVGRANYTEFNGAFSVQKKVGKDWQDVKTDLSLDQSGMLTVELPALDADGNVITYRFHETLPEGWHAPGDVDATEMFSVEFTLVDGNNKPVDMTEPVRMNNDRNGSITLTKTFFDITKDGYQAATGKHTATFDLYQQAVGASEATLYRSELTTTDGKLEIADLPRLDSNQAAYQYYLVETKVDGTDLAGSGYAAQEGTTVPITVEEETKDAYGPYTFVPVGNQTADLDQEVTVRNEEQKAGVLVTKENSLTEEFVPGAKFTVYLYDSNTKGEAVGTETEITANGVFVKLDPGHQYLVEETGVPQGYQPVVRTVTVEELEAGETATAVLKNRPDPRLLVTKKLQGNGAAESTLTTGVEFGVYTKDTANNTFTQVKGYDRTTPLTITPGKAAQLPAGIYYLKETVTAGNPNNILDPSDHSGDYAGKGEQNGDTFYFGPVTVAEATATSTQTQYEVINYSQLGAVTVTKTDHDNQLLSGATFTIYAGNEVKGTATTGNNGTATFTDLPIYDTEGQKITYTIRETQPPKGYSASTAKLQVQLQPGQTVTQDINDNPLTVVNLPEVDFVVTKVFRKLWEYNYTHKDYKLPGTQVALFEKQDDGYHYVTMGTTDELGMVTFEGLRQDTEYVAVEYSIPDTPDYAYLVPNRGGNSVNDSEYLKTTYHTVAELEGKVLTADQLAKYNYVTKPVLAQNANPENAVAGTLINVEHWTQLQIKKWLYDEDYTGNKVGVGQKATESPINNAEFELYMQILPDGTAEDAALVFDKNNPDNNYTLIGTYSSGTLYNSDGVRLDGWFGTDILNGGRNIVYWLVETHPGVGAKVKPETEITLIRPDGREYTNATPAPSDNDVICSNAFYYYKDQVSTGDVENYPGDGPGEELYAIVRIAKWADSLNADGDPEKNYTPLGNATFDLYLVDQNGQVLQKLDTMTTGLDKQDPDKLTAWASSRAIEFNRLCESVYGKDETIPTDEDNPLWKDSDGNGYARVLLVESGTPAGYSTPTEAFRMLLFFEKPETSKTTTTFNDAYYVKDKTTDVTLADAVVDTVWPCYPTKEAADGKYESIPVPDGKATGQYRLVNLPVDNFAVTVTKYGYTVDENTVDKTAAELDAYYSQVENLTKRTALGGVKMELQRYNATSEIWQDWNCIPTASGGLTNEFTSDGNGYYAFPNGLVVGRYRIIETSAAIGYENTYNGKASGSSDPFYDENAYYFVVTNSNLNLSLYNPKKLDLTILKTDTGTTNLSGATFQLTGTATITSNATGTDGKATLQAIGTGTYVLSESGTPAGYSSRYLEEYLAAAYGSNTTVTVNDKEYKLSEFATSGKGIYLGYTIEHRTTGSNTGETVVTKKIDLSSYDVSDLVLDIQNPALCSLTITKEDAQNPDTKLEGAVFKLERKDFTSWSGEEEVTDSGWTYAGTLTTGSDGTATKSGLQPGVYKVTETTAPDDYSLDTTPQYVVLTGGMNKTVTMDGETLTSEQKDGALAFSDYQLVSLTVTKTVNAGALDVTGEHSFTFELTDNAGNKVEKTLQWSKGTTNPSITFEDLEQGKDYTLTEKSTAGFVLTEITGDHVTDAGNGSYTVTIPKGATAVQVTATAANTYLYGDITVQKMDGETHDPLIGATFTVYKADGTTEVGTMTDNGDGTYTLRVPLQSNQAETFVVKETAAPAGYVLLDRSITVEVNPGQSVTYDPYKASTMTSDEALLDAKIFPNYKGAVIKLTKYDNVHGTQTPLLLEGAEFTLYEKKDGDTWKAVDKDITGDDGTLRFTVDGGKVYAIRETDAPSGFAGLDGVWTDGDQPLTVEDGYYLLNGGEPLQISQTYTYEAYNVPYVALEIRKENALEPNKRPAPTATVNLYEVPSDTPATLTKDQIAKIMEREPTVKDIDVSELGTDPAASAYYSCATVDQAQGIAVGKTYLAVETYSSISQIRDHDAVVWYQVYTVPAQGERIITLKNVAGDATQTLEKTATKTEYDSLLSAAADLQYTITPQVYNTYPLDSYVLTDTGLENAVALDQTTDTPVEIKLDNSYLKEKYSITQITLEPSSHNSAAYNGGVATNDLKATVTFYGFDDQPLGAVQTVAADTQQVVRPTVQGKVKSFSVSYASAELQAKTGYALGQDFKPGAVTVNIRLDKQEGGDGVYAIREVTNRAKTEMTYRPWDDDGTQQAETTDEKEATVQVEFAETKSAKVSVTKTADTQSIKLGDTIRYTIEVTNAADAEAPMQDPFVVDLLPQGSKLTSTKDIQLVNTPQGISIDTITTPTRNGEGAVFIDLKGNLNPGETIQIQLSVETTTQVAQYGAEIKNYVVVGSNVPGIKSYNNPQGSSYKTSDDKWPKNLDTVLTTLQNTPRLETLRSMLKDVGRDGFGFVSNLVGVNWTADSGAKLVKTGMGDFTRDQGYTSDQLSTVTNGGWMKYQLLFSNLSDAVNITYPTLLDIFPFDGDKSENTSDRGSQWSMKLDTNEAITVQIVGTDGALQEVPTTDFKIFYYTRNIGDANIQSVYDAVGEIHFDTKTTDLPDGWQEEPSEDAKAIAITVNKVEEYTLSPNESYLVTYKMGVNTYNQADLADVSWKNAVNNFVSMYQMYPENGDISNARDANAVVSSNSVSNTILPVQVKVGGHIWIDKNADGYWDAGESVSALQGNEMVEQLLKDARVTLYTYSGTVDTPTGNKAYDKGSDTEWYTKANFIFDNLEPAEVKPQVDENQLYSNNVVNNMLNPMHLLGTAPKTYNITVELPANSDVKAKVTTLTGSGKSRDPNQLKSGKAYAKEAQDNNYTSDGRSERFYLFAEDPAVVFDNTKDIGFVLQRDLVINKTAATDSNVKLKGAEFKVYGPFDSVDAANRATLQDAGTGKNLVATVTTDENGQATVQGLNWFQCYVIVETKPAPNYRLEGADGKSSDAPLTDYTGQVTSNPAWVLGIPGNTSTVTTQHMNVTNKTDVQYSIAATKALEGTALKDQQFQFELLDENMQRIKTAYNIGDVVAFGKFDANAAGTVTYYIREMIPAGAQGDVFQDIRYDTALYKVVVTITTDKTTGKLVPSVAYYRNSGSAQQSAVFTNVYLPAQRTTCQPAVLKQFTEDSDPRPSDAYFTFTLEPQADYGAAVELPIKAGDTVCKVQVHSGGPAYFDPIWFNEEGVYRFTIREVNEGKVGYRYDTATWTLEIQTAKSDGKLVVARADYSVDGKGGYTIAEFVNYYEEGLPPETPSQDGTLPATTGDAFIAQTSDPSNPVLWVVLMVVALVGVGVAFWLKKRGRNRK